MGQRWEVGPARKTGVRGRQERLIVGERPNHIAHQYHTSTRSSDGSEANLVSVVPTKVGFPASNILREALLLDAVRDYPHALKFARWVPGELRAV